MIVVKTAFEVRGQAVESYWLLLGDTKIRDIIVPNQDVSFASVHVNSTDVLQMKNEIHNNKWKILGWGHSHANFGVFFSGTDIRNQERILHETNNYAMIDFEPDGKLRRKYDLQQEMEIKYSFGSTLNIHEDKYAEVIWMDESKNIYKKKIEIEVENEQLTESELTELKLFKKEIEKRFISRN